MQVAVPHAPRSGACRPRGMRAVMGRELRKSRWPCVQPHCLTAPQDDMDHICSAGGYSNCQDALARRGFCVQPKQNISTAAEAAQCMALPVKERCSASVRRSSGGFTPAPGCLLLLLALRLRRGPAAVISLEPTMAGKGKYLRKSCDK